jgi:hypothetical protein
MNTSLVKFNNILPQKNKNKKVINASVIGRHEFNNYYISKKKEVEDCKKFIG